MRKVFASIAVVTAVAVGGLTVAAVNPLAAVSAKGGQVPTTSQPAADQTGHVHRHGRRHLRGRILNQGLKKVVKDGKITEDQATAVRDAVKDRAKLAGKRFAKAHTRTVEAAAQAIGITPDELRTALKGGQSVAQVAQSKQVDPQKVIDALVSAGTARVDQAVTAGKIKAERAAKIKERLPQAAAKIVNRVPKQH